MPNWKQEITVTRIHWSSFASKELGRPGKLPSGVVEEAQEQLYGDEWEIVDHKFSKVDDQVYLSIMWRKPADKTTMNPN